MITPFTNFESGLGPGVIIESDPEQSPESYDYAGLVMQARRSIKIDSEREYKTADTANNGICEGEDSVIYVGEEFNEDVPIPKGYMDVAAVEDAYNELDSMAARTSADCWWFPTLRQLETRREDLAPDELPDRDGIMTLIKYLEVDAQRFLNAGAALLRACDDSQEAFDKYRYANK